MGVSNFFSKALIQAIPSLVILTPLAIKTRKH